MYQRCFDNASETLFVAGKTPRLSRFAFSDDPKWESGHHVHDNETELIYVKKGVARFTIDSSLYVAHADDIVVIERGRLHAVASDVNDPATTCTCALYGFQFQGAEENQLLQPHSCPVIAAGQGKEVIKTLFNELSVILPQSKNSQTSSLWDAFAYTLAILYYENFKNAYRSEQGYICHEFTKEYRISPINYVIQRRMTEAKWSLTNTELSQAEISWRVGYENVDHFAKLFLRHVGCSPSDYRRQFKNCFAEQEILSEFPQPVSLAG